MPPPVLVSGCLGLDDEGTRPRSPSEASLEDQEQVTIAMFSSYSSFFSPFWKWSWVPMHGELMPPFDLN
ncbi:hypothetical protein DPMN_013666 [Dreissena polymorpha]|uniref:Uncharacterized protein n=1 Tax=Dreissena polymorpha TaxID=45954 RepID=A0A9D4S4I7_DREPO|nr:hypothetical protein DPMN_013666 [Dreissena polymorpha]